jgi:HlyD family secretion protein
VGLALLAFWWARGGERKVEYLTARIERGMISQTVTATGTVNPVATVQVGTYVSGPIQAIFADFNSRVRKGQVIAKIDPRPFLMKERQAEAKVASARAKVLQDEVDLRYKELTLARTKELFERTLISEDDLDVARSDYEKAKAQLDLDRAALAEAEAALEEARVNLGYTDIVSPVDGIVVSRDVDVGQTVAASFQTPVLFLIAEDLTRMQVNANVSESDIGLVSEGDLSWFTVDAYPDRTFAGAVRQIRNSPIVVQNVVTYDVVIEVDNSDLALKPGMTATVSIRVAHREDALKVPMAALRFRPPGTQASEEDGGLVWVLGAAAEPRAVPVVTGLSDGVDAELVEGALREGDEVIVGFKPAAAADEGVTLPGFGMRFRARRAR